MPDNATIIGCALLMGLLVFLLFGGVLKCKTKESFTQYSESSPACQTGSGVCQLSTGKYGLCDRPSGRCVDIRPKYGIPDVPSVEPRSGQEFHKNCWHGLSVCNLSDGSSGVCGLGGVCFHASHLAQ